MRRKASDFLPVRGGKALEDRAAVRGENDVNLAAVFRAALTQKFSGNRRFTRPTALLMGDLKPLSQFTDRNTVATREPLHGEQRLMMARRRPSARTASSLKRRKRRKP